jgi:2-dehydropantoate 2-reductase
MKIAVMGSGAVGGYFGAKLAADRENEIAFIARGAHLEAMKKHGLLVKRAEGELSIRNARFTADPAEVGSVDLVLFCVKSYDTEAAAQALAPMIGPETIVLSLQNGIDNPDKIARLYGEQRTLAGIVYVGAALAAPGVIEYSTGGRIIFGTLQGKPSRTADRVAQVLDKASVPHEISSNIRKVQWRKLLWNAPFCAISSLVHATMDEIMASDALSQLALDCMEEVRRAAALAGIELEPELVQETMDFSKTLGSFKPSMLQDLEAGKPLEYEAFNGIVVGQLKRARQSAPVNSVFESGLKFLDQRIRSRRKG